MPSDVRPSPKTLLGTNPKLEWKAAEYEGGIHERGVVRSVDRNRQQILTSDNGEGCTRKPQRTPSPQTRDIVLPAAVFFKARGSQRHAAEYTREQEEQRAPYQVRTEPLTQRKSR